MNDLFSPDHLQILSDVTLVGFILVFLAGLTMAFNPRSLMVVPVIMGYLAGPHGEGSLGKVFAFALGITLADVALGVFFALMGKGVSMIFGPRWELFLGIVLIVLGLRWLRVLHFSSIGFEVKGMRAGSVAGAFLLGIPFSLSLCPFCIPVLLTILTVAAATGMVWYSAALMVFFSLGRVLPLIVAGVSVNLFKKTELLQRYFRILEIAGGGVLLSVGLIYLYRFYQYVAAS